ncbi:MAG: efflux transporter outer membrane subunit, partial [Desulfobacterales bacterium]
LLIMVTGCAMVGPDYKRPAIDTPASWRFEEQEARDLANTAWWEQFNDPVLNDLVRTALAQNRDLLIATARVEEFFGRYFSTRGGQFPFAEAGGSAFRERMTEKGPTPLPSGVDTTFNYYEAFLGGSWEIDFWGKYRRASEAARAELFGTEEARRTVVLTLVSAVAGTYVDLLALDKQLEITRRTVETRSETRDLFQLRLDNGIIPEIDVSMAEAEYQDALGRIPEIELAIARAENALSVLLGNNPGPIPRGLTIDELLLPGIPSGLPSDLMERRPDIRAAEQALIAANAQIGVAKSLYFPTISLTGAFGTVSTDLSDLFTGPSKAWNFGVPLTVPIFTAGRIGGEVKGAEAFQQQVLFSYLQAVQNAFREVDDALVERAKSDQRLQSLNRQVAALENYARLARMRYDEGVTSFLEVLDSERSLFNVELSKTAGQNTLFRSLITIYKAMGGGWVEAAEAAVTSQPVMEAGFIP